MSVITYDDRDPIIQYSGAWVRGGNPEDLNGTSTFADTGTGTTATITFKGTEISVFGTIPIATPKTTSAYSIDGGSPALFTASFNIGSAGNSTNGFFYRQHYFTSANLSPDTPHTLVISQTDNVGTRYLIDYIEVVSGTTTTSSPAPSPSPVVILTSSDTSAAPSQPTTDGRGTSSSTTSSSTSTSTSPSPPASLNSSTTFVSSSTSGFTSALSANTDATTLPDASSSSSNKSPIGLIVGATIGGLAVLVLCVLSYILWKHLKLRKRAARAAALAEKEEVEARPFHYHDEPSTVETPVPSAPMASQTTRYPTGKSHRNSTAAQYDYGSVGEPRYSRYTLLQPPPKYEG
ncbi:hypothetical protein BDN70DRAFT_104025 [Pholiota conissans]|uniref:Uncharacterized protein n=1 Tax=Pholiota conissans TaxID=109636 RepID=A0A9P5ZBD0_9AGAR|nr:hypothetical protein BDN70DRAFT_104025 [Pholiota conissans]